MIKNDLFFNKANLDEISQFQTRINKEFQSGEVGYYHLPDFNTNAFDELKSWLCGRDFKNLVLVGVGGSSLGTKAIYHALKKSSEIKVSFLDNMDEYLINKILKKLEFNSTLFIISSKSGTTIETITIFKILIAKFGISKFSDNFIFITDSGSLLEKFAKDNGSLVLNIPSNVGGRFSVLSPVGLVPLFICGLDISALLNGAKACENEQFIEQNPTILQKAYHYVTHKSATINVIFTYCDRLKFFNEWYVQLWAESLGKKSEFLRVGRTPVALIGSKDQHSFLQLIMDGPKDKTVTFISIIDNNSQILVPDISLKGLESCDFVNNLSVNELLNYQCEATKRSVIDEGISIDSIELSRLDEWNMGYLVYYYELLTSAMGIMLDINTYDQPGVEVGKRILKNIISKNYK
ncbi:MAG: glucose-6-phosphate isomerase [Campylobacter sp.]|nr:glucose-6-phosphate isomerase [Campylobacter sp.]